MANGWTEKRRAKQTEAIKLWQPWKSSTGPRTESGKFNASQNAWKGGERPAMRALSAILREQHKCLNEVAAVKSNAIHLVPTSSRSMLRPTHPRCHCDLQSSSGFLV